MKKDISFEESISKLESIVSKLESGDESLEESIKLFSEGTNIAGICYDILNNAEQKIKDLSDYAKNGDEKEVDGLD